MRLIVKQARPSGMNNTVRHAVEFKAYKRVKRRKTECKVYLYSANQSDAKSDKLY